MNLRGQNRDGSGTNGAEEGLRIARAFTLIEVMMVVAIVGLTLAMGLPSFLRVIHRQGIGKAEYELVEACQAARRAAIMNNQITKLIIHPIQRTFEVPGAYPAKELPDDIVIDILGVNFVELESAEEAEVRFTPKGFSDEFTVVLHSSGGQYVKIYLDTVTALPQVENIR
jgi:prepilin-type N-terminal cleavage/methylation domain-containing protein